MGGARRRTQRHHRRPRARQRGTVGPGLPRRASDLVVAAHQRPPIRHVQHVVQCRREQPAVAVREALHQGGALRGRAHRLPVRQSGGQRRARAFRLDHEVRHREHERILRHRGIELERRQPDVADHAALLRRFEFPNERIVVIDPDRGLEHR